MCTSRWKDGRDISPLISAIDVRIRPNNLIIAYLAVMPGQLSLTAEMRFSDEDLGRLAEAHGFDLVHKLVRKP